MLGLTKVMIVGCAATLLVGGAVAGWHVSHDATTLPQPTCGSVVTHLLSSDTELLSARAGAVACFSAAARNCRAGSIAVSQMGVDGGGDYVFAIDPGGRPCQVTEYSQWWTANFGGHQSNVTATPCFDLAVVPAGVTMRCGGQQVLIPA